MSRMVSQAEMAAVMNRFDPPASDLVLRRYSVALAIVATVDNQGAQCEYCGDVDHLVLANVYVTDMDGQDHCADTCGGCVTYVIDGHLDTNPDMPVIVELAQGVN